jgi:ubiquinone/menaquinone biosynthesis C-methylase UbiE
MDAEKVARAYSSPNWWYDLRGFLILHLSYRDGLVPLVNFFASNGSARHLEIAVGSGSFLELVMVCRKLQRRPALRGVAMDYAPSMLSGAVRRLKREHGWTVERADAAHLPYASESFETANIANALHSIPDAAGAVAEVYRVLRPGGTLAVNVVLVPRGGKISRWIADRIARWGMRKGILVRPYEENEIRQLFVSRGFEVLKTRIRGNDYCLLAQKPLCRS